MQKPLLPDHPLTTRELAEFMQTSPRTVEGWRRRGIGPRFFKISGNRVRYLPGDVLEFVEANASFGGEAAE